MIGLGRAYALEAKAEPVRPTLPGKVAKGGDGAIGLGFQNNRERDAYAAGIVDGEGTVSLTKASRVHTTADGSRRVQPPHCAAHVLVEMVDSAVPLWLHDTYGGPSPRVYDGSRPQHRASTRWGIHGYAAARFLQRIRPFLRVKDSHADVIVAFYAEVTMGTFRGQEVPDSEIARRQQAWLALKELNVRGIEVST